MTAFAQGPGPRDAKRDAIVWSDPSYAAHQQRRHRWIDDARFARADAVPAVLRERARTRVDGGWVRRVGEGEVLGALLDEFGFGGGAGCVCDVCAAEVLTLAAPVPA